MNTGRWVRRGAALALVVAVGGGVPAFAQGAMSPPAATASGSRYGPGMMPYHQGAMGPGAMVRHGATPGGYGMGPGAMGGYGMGPDVKVRYVMRSVGPDMMYGYGMGPGMMGAYGMGPGMMGAYGMGPGMMYGYGMDPNMTYGYGMGPRMMYGAGGFRGTHGFHGGWMGHVLGLSSAQRDKIAAIHEHTFRAAWPIMGRLIEQQSHFERLAAAAEPDQAAIDKAYDELSALKKQLLDLHLQARRQFNAVLSAEQRKRLEELHGGGGR